MSERRQQSSCHRNFHYTDSDSLFPSLALRFFGHHYTTASSIPVTVLLGPVLLITMCSSIEC